MPNSLFLFLVLTLFIFCLSNPTTGFPAPKTEEDIDRLRFAGHSERDIVASISSTTSPSAPSYYLAPASRSRTTLRHSLSNLASGTSDVTTLFPLWGSSVRPREHEHATNTVISNRQITLVPYQSSVQPTRKHKSARYSGGNIFTRVWNSGWSSSWFARDDRHGGQGRHERSYDEEARAGSRGADKAGGVRGDGAAQWDSDGEMDAVRDVRMLGLKPRWIA